MGVCRCVGVRGYMCVYVRMRMYVRLEVCVYVYI